MSFRLPTADHKARALFDVAHVAEILAPQNVSKLLSTLQARKLAEHQFAVNPATSRVCFVIVRADSDERWLISFGKRGGWRKEWNFGKGA